jgi:hypothetical protein
MFSELCIHQTFVLVSQRHTYGLLRKILGPNALRCTQVLYCTVRRPLDKMHQHLIRGRRLTAKRTRQFSCFCLFLSCPIPLFIYFYFVMRSSKFHCRMACRFHLFKELYRFFFLFLRRVFF